MAIVRLPREYELFLDELMFSAPYYGAFDIINKTNFASDVSIRVRIGKVSDKTVIDLLVMFRDFLCDNGYAIRRIDITNQPDTNFIELTERGRWLKEQGTFTKYVEYQEGKIKKKEDAEKLEKSKEDDRQISLGRESNMNRLTFWIAVATVIAATYYSLEILNHIFNFYPH